MNHQPSTKASRLVQLLAGGLGALWWAVTVAGLGADPTRIPVEDPNRADGATFSFHGRGPGTSDTRTFALPREVVAGTRLRLAATIQAHGVGPGPHSWDGLKVMVKIESPRGTTWPQLTISGGSFDAQTFTGLVFVPEDATRVTLVLGLANVVGDAVFRQVWYTALPWGPLPGPAPADQPIYTGRDHRLRGAMVNPATLTRADFDVLTKEWKANLVRWQLIRPAHQPRDPASYLNWLEGALAKLDEGLRWAQENGTMVVVDLHSPPGGEDGPGGYQQAGSGLFSSRSSEDLLVQIWAKIALRYRGNPAVWGFDLVNEPIDTDTSEDCLDWNALAPVLARGIRAVDPDRTLIVEPAQGGGAPGFSTLVPLDLDRVVYSFHMYTPGAFTHQGVYFPRGPRYPGTIDGQVWDQTALRLAMQPAIDFAAGYRVHLYVGEFSAARWAPGAEQYLADLVGLFEDLGWDWSYHAFREWDGWSLEGSADPADHRRTTDNPRWAVMHQAFAANTRGSPTATSQPSP